MKPCYLTTRTNHAKYGQRIEVAGTPMILVKAAKRKDIISLQEIAEDLYGRHVKKIIFEDDENKT